MKFFCCFSKYHSGTTIFDVKYLYTSCPKHYRASITKCCTYDKHINDCYLVEQCEPPQKCWIDHQEWMEYYI